MGELEAFQCFESLTQGHRLFVHEELHDVAVRATSGARVGVGHRMDGEGSGMVIMEGTVPDERRA